MLAAHFWQSSEKEIWIIWERAGPRERRREGERERKIKDAKQHDFVFMPNCRLLLKIAFSFVPKARPRLTDLLISLKTRTYDKTVDRPSPNHNLKCFARLLHDLERKETSPYPCFNHSWLFILFGWCKFYTNSQNEAESKTLRLNSLPEQASLWSTERTEIEIAL